MDIASLLTSTSPTFTTVQIGPAEAEILMAANTRNRTIRTEAVKHYARDMAAGSWRFNGDAIRISKTGVVLDGQHRLAAVIRAGVTLEFLIVSGLDEEAQDTMDSGRVRRMGDVLRLNGEVNTSGLAALLCAAWQWDNGNRRLQRSVSAPTKMEMVQFLDDHPELRRAAELSDLWYRKFKFLPKMMWGVGWYALNQVDQEESLWFFQNLCTGAGLDEGDPLLTLRNRILTDRRDNKSVSNGMWMGYIVRAWNAKRQDRTLAKIQHGPDSEVPIPV